MSYFTVHIFLESHLKCTALDNPGGPHMWDVPVSKITVYYVRVSAHLTTVTPMTRFEYAWL